MPARVTLTCPRAVTIRWISSMLLLSAGLLSVHPREQVDCCADDKGTEIAEMRVTWSGRCHWG